MLHHSVERALEAIRPSAAEWAVAQERSRALQERVRWLEGEVEEVRERERTRAEIAVQNERRRGDAAVREAGEWAGRAAAFREMAVEAAAAVAAAREREAAAAAREREATATAAAATTEAAAAAATVVEAAPVEKTLGERVVAGLSPFRKGRRLSSHSP